MPVFYYEKKSIQILESSSGFDASIYDVVNDDASDATDKTSDGHTFFLVLEEQGDDCKDNTDGAEPEAKDVQQRNP